MPRPCGGDATWPWPEHHVIGARVAHDRVWEPSSGFRLQGKGAPAESRCLKPEAWLKTVMALARTGGPYTNPVRHVMGHVAAGKGGEPADWRSAGICGLNLWPSRLTRTRRGYASGVSDRRTASGVLRPGHDGMWFGKAIGLRLQASGERLNSRLGRAARVTIRRPTAGCAR